MPSVVNVEGYSEVAGDSFLVKDGRLYEGEIGGVTVKNEEHWNTGAAYFCVRMNPLTTIVFHISPICFTFI